MTTCDAASRPSTRPSTRRRRCWAGDSLHALAFEVLADPATHEDPFARSELVLELARASGPTGMAGGQMMDLAAEDTPFDLGETTRLQQLKTGALIGFCLEAGAIMGRIPGAFADAPCAAMPAISAWPSRSPTTCSTSRARPRIPARRCTRMPVAARRRSCRCSASTRARTQAQMLIDQAIEHLKDFGQEADLLRAIARFAIERDR